MCKNRIILLLAILLLSGQSFAQKVLKVREVTVTATRRVEEEAVTKSEVDSLQLAQYSNNSLAELLTRSTPVFVKSYGQGSEATVSFRGTGASHTQVEWNGININNPMLGQVDFSQIPVWFVDKVELYHGGSSLQNGSGALGGAINIGSSPRWGEKYYGSVVQGFGSFGKYQTVATAGFGASKFQVRVRYIYERAENDFTYLNNAIPPFERVTQKNAEYSKNGLSTDLWYNAGKKNYFSLNFWYHTSDRNVPTIMSYEGLGRKENNKNDDIRIVGKWRKFWTNVQGEFTTGYSRTDMDYLLSNNTYLQWVENVSSRSYTNSFFNKYNLKWNLSKKSVVKGSVNLDYHDVQTLNKLTSEGYAQDRVEGGATVSFHHTFNNTFSGYALLREEITDGKFSPIMPSVGLSSKFLKEKNLYIAVNGTRNYHKPTLNDLYWQPGGNPDLRPEEGYTGDLSIGYDTQWGALSFKADVNGYLSLINDWIIWQPSEFMYWSAENIQKVFSRGVEANFMLGYTISDFKFTFDANYAYTKTTNESDDILIGSQQGKQLIYIPEHKANTLFETVWKGYYFNFAWSFTGERYTTSSNELTRHQLPYFSVCDMTIGKKIYFGERDKTALDIQFKVNNIFNVDYQSILWRAMPGVNYMLQIKFDF